MFKINLKNIRLEKHLTQKQLATLIQVEVYTISDWEQGRSEPCIDDIKKLCIVFDISADELLELETEAQRREVNINNSFNNNTGKQNINF